MRTCILLMRSPGTREDGERLLGMAEDAAPDVAIFLLGDGVLCARKGLADDLGSTIGAVLAKGGAVRASGRDIRARGIDPAELLKGISIEEDLEGGFLDEAMEKAGRVMAW
ncbi:MAG: DsrE family protein [Methanomassiliicoccales archaeon]|nr:DsrE family protein [Methanomassiliicoccales archaeon]